MEEEEKNTFTVVKLAPHMITILALCLSLFSVRLSIMGDFLRAALYIVLAGIMDAVDGKVARKLNASSEFGAQMDSLADFFDFGIAPGFLVYFWKMQYANDKLLAWLPVLLLAVCMAIRLARFNADLGMEDPDSPLVKYFFKGSPAPMDALWVLLPLAIETEFGIVVSPMMVIVNTIVAAFFTASTIPTITPKRMKIRNEYKNLVLLSMGVFLVCCVLKLWLTFIVFFIAYLMSIVAGWPIYFNFKRKMNLKKGR
jgi:CDP-diacylglycerol--serine O-phosphatidyltransferase